jgi:hypothetical protein
VGPSHTRRRAGGRLPGVAYKGSIEAINKFTAPAAKGGDGRQGFELLNVCVCAWVLQCDAIDAPWAAAGEQDVKEDEAEQHCRVSTIHRRE